MLHQPHSSVPRIPYTQRCTVSFGGRTQHGLVCNVGVLGVYLTVDEIPDEGEVVRVAFSLPGGGGIIEVDAVVTWRNVEEPQRTDCLPPGCGVRFEKLTDSVRAQLASLVSEYKDQLPLGIGAPVPHSGYLRVPYVQRCRLSVDDGPRFGVVCNVSTLGVYVATEPIPEVGERIEVAFLLPADPRTFRSPTTVTWRNADPAPLVDSLAPGCGLRFEGLPTSERMRIERVVHDYYRGTTPLD